MGYAASFTGTFQQTMRFLRSKEGGKPRNDWVKNAETENNQQFLPASPASGH
jgi:hypothetical protein